MEHKHHLRERVVAQVSLRPQGLHQQLEREILMGVCVHCHFPDSSEQLQKTGIAGEVRPHQQDVDEASDEGFGVGMITI